jgi:hypothetical protein
MSRRLEPAEPMNTLTIPKELWYPTPVETNVCPRPSLDYRRWSDCCR